MKKVSIDCAGGSYEVLVGSGTLKQAGGLVVENLNTAKVVVFCDQNIKEFYAESLLQSFAVEGVSVTVRNLCDGERGKTLATVESAYGFLAECGAERSTVIVALGGGVTGDTAGFVAATWMRGLPFIQIPTTLLSMVDASVGGKVGVNLPYGKNLVGAFHQPKLVIVDPSVLSTLPRREFSSGLAECVKHAVISGSELFVWLEDNAQAIMELGIEVLSELIFRNVQVKAGIVKQDEREKGPRALLNFGHTFGHAIEASAGYGVIAHGEAVGLGMLAATELARSRGLCDEQLGVRLRKLLERFNLPVSARLDESPRLIEFMKRDKKVAGGKLRVVLPRALGRVEIFDDCSDEEITAAWDSIRL